MAKVDLKRKVNELNQEVQRKSNMSLNCWLEKSNGGQNNCPSIIAIKSHKEPAVIFRLSDKLYQNAYN